MFPDFEMVRFQIPTVADKSEQHPFCGDCYSDDTKGHFMSAVYYNSVIQMSVNKHLKT